MQLDLFLGLGTAGRALNNNICWDTLFAVGTVYSGDTVPTHTSDGTLIYNIQFDTSTGLFLAQFGDLGQTQLEAVNEQLETNTVSLITFTYDGKYEMEMYWDDVNLDYRGTDIALASELALGVGTRVCFGAYVSPDMFLYLDLVTNYEEDA